MQSLVVDGMPVVVDGQGNVEIAHQAVPKPDGFTFGESTSIVEAVSIGDHERIAHVAVPSARDGSSWEILAVPKPGGGAQILYSGLTGYAHGEDGERTGDVVTFLGDGTEKTVVVGQLREDLRICGQDATVLDPRALDPKIMQLRGASMQRLSKSDRANASHIVATARRAPAEKPLAPLLVAAGSSNSQSSANALVDGDPTTTWSESRPGTGAGEFVVLRSPAEIPVTRLELTLAPPADVGAKPSPKAGAPKTLYLATETKLYQVTLPEDATQHPGEAYTLDFADPIVSPCMAVVLDEAYAKDAHPDVAIAEVTAYSQMDKPGATLTEVAKALAGGSPRSSMAAAILKRAGDAGLAAVDAAWSTLDTPGRTLGADVAASAPCSSSAPILIRAMIDRDHELNRKGEGTLDRCGRAALPALAKVVGEGDERARSIERAAFMRASHITDPKILPPILSDASRTQVARIDLLRATSARLPEIAADADAAIDAALQADRGTRTRYLLLGPLASLARKGDAHASSLFVAMLSKDAEPMIRTHAAELASGVQPAQGALLAALNDPEPRVRDAALRTVADEHASPATVAVEHLLEKDPWSFVRATAATALGSFPAAVDIDRSLGAALKDPSPHVRTSVVEALGAHRARAFSADLAARVDDEAEALEVRVAAVRALGATCDVGSLGRLTDLAAKVSSPMAEDAEISLGMAAIDALGAIHPADLARRLAPLTARGVRAAVRKRALDAVAQPGTCK